MKEDNVFTLSPDGFSRFFVIIEALKKIYGNKVKKIRVLDVGGCSPYFRQIAEESGLDIDLTIVDILPQPKAVTGKYIQADITKWSPGDKKYDAVISTDVLEHIPADLKAKFVDACIKLAGDVCIIAAPFVGPGVDYAEKSVNEFNKVLFGSDQEWLKEHFEFGDPSKKMVEDIIARGKFDYEHFGTNNLYSWIFSSHVNLIEAKYGLDSKAANKIKREYNSNILASNEFTGDTYRHFYVVYKGNTKNVNVPKVFNATPNPDIQASYVHGMFSLVADRFKDFKDSIAKKDAEIAAANKKIELQKSTIDLQEGVLRDFTPELRRISRLKKKISRSKISKEK